MDLPTQVALSKIHPAPDAGTIDEQLVENLAASISSIGLLSPLTVRMTTPDCFEIIDGHLRASALRLLAHEMAQVEVKIMSDAEAIEARVAGTHIRKSRPTDFEAWKNLVRLESQRRFKTNSELASVLGLTRAHVTTLRSFAKLPAKCLELLHSDPALIDAKLANSLVASGLCDSDPELVTAALTALATKRIKNQDGIPTWLSKQVAKSRGTRYRLLVFA